MTNLRTNLFLIAVMGLAVFIVGLSLYVVADKLVRGRMLLVLPPIGCAAYIFVHSWSLANDISVLSGSKLLTAVGEIFAQTLIGAAAFMVVTFLMFGGLIIRNYLSSGSG